MDLTTVCVVCAQEYPEGPGSCPMCGAVALRPLQARDTAHPTTPLVRSHLADDLWLKVEGAQPTGTFKDRVMAQLVTEAVSENARGAVVASSGNAAVAAAAACLQRSVPLLVVVPATIAASKLRGLALRGTTVLKHGRDPSEAYALARHLARRFELKELASTFHSSGTEFACRAIGHEIVAELGRPPAAVAAAISVGPVLVGTGHGVTEMTGVRPALLAGQAAGCAPIARAFDFADDAVVAWDGPIETTAGSIADRLVGYAAEGTFALGQIRDSGGAATAWPDSDLHRFRAELARQDGIDVELSSAAALGAARSWTGSGPVVAVLTGAGWRDTLLGEEPPVTFDTSAFERAADINGLQEEVQTWTTSSS